MFPYPKTNAYDLYNLFNLFAKEFCLNFNRLRSPMWNLFPRFLRL